MTEGYYEVPALLRRIKLVNDTKRLLNIVVLCAISSTLILIAGTSHSLAQGQWQVSQNEQEGQQKSDQIAQQLNSEQSDIVQQPSESAKPETLKPETLEIESAEVEPDQAANADAPESLEQTELTSESNDTDTNVVITDAVPATLASAKPQTVVPSFDPKVLKNLDQQFQKVQQARETEDAFSAALGENYFSYGLLLKDVGRYDEAREMFLDALHITKINQGIYSIEQRPILKALFDVHFALGNSESFEDNLSRIIWLEKKERDLDDDFAFELALKVGNYYINQYLYNPIPSETSVALLDKARRYLSFAVARYGDAPLNEKLMPYGELALISYLRSSADRPLSRAGSFTQPTRRSEQFFRRTEVGFDQRAIAFNSGERSLKTYLLKAREDESTDQAVHALLGLGDVNLLFSRTGIATQYYQLAWLEVKKLAEDHPLHQQFKQPVQLPAFNYAQDRQPIERKNASLYIPMTFSVDRFGQVNNIVKINEGEPNFKYFNKARRALRKAKFRPTINEGVTVATDRLSEEVRIFVKRDKAG